MGEQNPSDETEQDAINLTDMDFFPATVNEMTYDDSGTILHTIDPDPDTDIRVFDDARPAARIGELGAGGAGDAGS